MSLPDYEKLGVFYLGREYDPATRELGSSILYDSRDLTTHAVCIGMTGSGKTGLCLSLLEEAALDGIPAIAIDPKGDIANLALTFPALGAADFKPWVDAGEAARKGQSIDEFAATTAENWRKGLEDWGQDGARIERLRAAARVTIYTPGSTSGRPLSILRSLAAPDTIVGGDAAAFNERIGSAVGGLLALLGIAADPLRSREQQLLAGILQAAWGKGQSLDLPALIQAVQRPPFERVGAFDLETFYPAKERTDLALRINGLLAAPGFETWLEGDPLDIESLLHDAAGSPRIAIISIAHLNDAERMFVVTLVANELIAWMRRQAGTTSLRAVFYMDEVFGYFPPTALPPSKLPLLTLMKQARAFGLGVVLATQNPVDLDYKGLGNAGTWLIGRLQTERDKLRVIEGLLGSDAGSGMDKAQLESLMSNLTQRTFLMRNVHDDAPTLLRTRWALSYLRGPLTLAEISRLTRAQAGPETAIVHAATAAANGSHASPNVATRPSSGGPATRPLVQAGVVERFLPATTDASGLRYVPRLGAQVRTHFVDAKAGLDAWETNYYLAPIADASADWSAAHIVVSPGDLELLKEPADGAGYGDVPGLLLTTRGHNACAKALADHVYRTATLTLLRCPALKMNAVPGGTEGEFRVRVAHAMHERRDAAVAALRQKFSARLTTLEDRLRRAEQRIDREKGQASSHAVSSALDVGGSLLGALFGGARRKSSMLGKAATAARSVGRAGKERADVAQAEADAAALREQLASLTAAVEAEVKSLEARFDPGSVEIESRLIKARKSDIAVEQLALVWQPA